MDALIVTDIQNDFLPGGALPVLRGDEVVGPTNRLLRRFPLSVATQDWHPADHVSFAENHFEARPFEKAVIDGREQVLWPAHAVQGTPGAELAAGLELGRLGHVTRKGTDPRIDSYSGFFDNDRRHATDLDAFLRSRGVTRVFVCGLALDYCVMHTALDAARLGYEVTVVEDACRGIGLSERDHEKTMGELAAAGVRVERSAALPAV